MPIRELAEGRLLYRESTSRFSSGGPVPLARRACAFLHLLACLLVATGPVPGQVCTSIQGTTSVAASPGGQLYTADAGSGTVSVVEPALDSNRSIVVGGSPARIAFDSVGGQALVLDPQLARLMFIAADDSQIVVPAGPGVVFSDPPLLVVQEPARRAFVGTMAGVWQVDLDTHVAQEIPLGGPALLGRVDSTGQLVSMVVGTVPATVATLEDTAGTFSLHAGIPFGTEGFIELATNVVSSTVYLLSASSGAVVALPLSGGPPFAFSSLRPGRKGIAVDPVLDRVIVGGSRPQVFTGQGILLVSDNGQDALDEEVIVPEPGVNRILIWQNLQVLRWEDFRLTAFPTPAPLARADGSIPKPVQVGGTDRWAIPAEQANALYELDVTTGAWSVFPLGFTGRFVAFDENLGRLSVLSSEGSAVVLDVDPLAVVSRLTLSFDPLTAVMDPVRSTLVVGGGWQGSLTAVDLGTGGSLPSLPGVNGFALALDSVTGRAYGLDPPGYLTEWDPAMGTSRVFSSSPDDRAKLVAVERSRALVFVAVSAPVPELEIFDRITGQRLPCTLPLSAPATSLTIQDDVILMSHAPEGRVTWVDLSNVVLTDCSGLGAAVTTQRNIAAGVRSVRYEPFTQQGLVLSADGAAVVRVKRAAAPGLPADLVTTAVTLLPGDPATDLFVDDIDGTVLLSRASDLVLLRPDASQASLPIGGAASVAFDAARRDAYVLTDDNLLHRVDLLTDTSVLIGDVATLWRCLPLPASVVPLTSQVDQFDERFLYVGTEGAGFYRSDDGGGSFQPRNTGLTSTMVYAIAQDPLTPDVLYLGTESGVFRSTDRGTSWSPTSLIGLADPVRDVVAVDDGAGGTVVLAGVDGGGVFRSVDGGATFPAANTGLTNFRLQELEDEDDSDDTPTPIWGITAGGGPFVSTDLGATWTPASGSTVPIGSLDTVSVAARAGEVWVGTADAGVFRSQDDGASWQSLNAGLPAGSALDVEAVEILETGRVLAGLDDDDQGGVFTFDAVTTNWTGLNQGLTNRKVVDLSSSSGTLGQRVFASTQGGFFGARLEDRDTDGDGVSDFLDADDDNDGIFDAADCAPRDALVGGALPEVTSLQLAGGGVLSWDASAGATSYQVFRGGLAPGERFYSHLCQEDVTGFSFQTSSATSLGSLDYFLVGAANRCTGGTLGSAAAIPRPHPGCDLDADNDLVPDIVDQAPLDPLACLDADLDGCDDCAGVGLQDICADGPDLDGDCLCDTGDADRDGDTVANIMDPAPDDPVLCGDGTALPLPDGCDDCSSDQAEDFDGDDLCDLFDDDDDNDSVLDGLDPEPHNINACGDSDGDLCDDCIIFPTAFPASDGTDFDLDGLCDFGDPDDDNDGNPDIDDNCPFKASNNKSDSNGDGIGNICSIHVEQDGSGDFTDLPSAAAVAQPGDVLLVGPGTYVGGIGLPAGVSVIGVGPLGSAVLSRPNPAFAVITVDSPFPDVLKAGGTTIANLEFHGQGVSSNGGTITSNRFRSDCTIPGRITNTSAAVTMSTFGISGTIADNEFLDLNRGCTPEQEADLALARFRAINAASNVLVSGNVIDNARLVQHVVEVGLGLGSVVVEDNMILDTEAAAAIVLVGSSVGPVVFRGNIVSGFKQIIDFPGTEVFDDFSGVVTLDRGDLVENNVITNNMMTTDYAGMTVAGWSHVVNNLITGNQSSGVNLLLEVPGNCLMCMIGNNTIAFNGSPSPPGQGTNTALFINGSGGSIIIQNNLISNNTEQLVGGVRIDPALDAMVFNNNLFGNFPRNYVFDDLTGVDGNISLDPLLDGHGRPTAGSPCVDAGREIGAPLVDVEGNSRPVDCDGDAIPETDIGAFEVQCP